MLEKRIEKIEKRIEKIEKRIEKIEKHIVISYSKQELHCNCGWRGDKSDLIDFVFCPVCKLEGRMDFLIRFIPGTAYNSVDASAGKTDLNEDT